MASNLLRSDDVRKAAVIVVALASFGMARRWVVREPLPSHDKSRIVEVESSEYASLRTGGHSIQPLTTPKTYPGKATFFVPANAAGEFEVDGICGGCSKCETPKNTFVRITSTKNIASWRLDASSAVHDVLLDPDKDMRTTFTITATGGASGDPSFRIEGDDGYIRDTVYGYVPSRMTFWRRPSMRMVVTIKAYTSIEGPCPSEAPCQPPHEAKLAITNVVTEELEPVK